MANNAMRRLSRLKYTLPTVAVAFVVGFFAGGRAATVAPPDGPQRDPVTFVRPDSVWSGLAGDDDVLCRRDENGAPTGTLSRSQRRRALATLLGEDRTGPRRLLVGHETLTRALDDGRGRVVADVFWELGRRSEEVEYVPTLRQPWFSALSGVIYDTALAAARRDDGTVSGQEWLSGFMIPVRVHGYGILLARFAWHTQSGQTGEIFDRPRPALELFEPADAGRTKRTIEAYEALMR